MVGEEVWLRHWRAQDRRTRWAVRWAGCRGREVADPDLAALVAGYARRERAPMWPVAFTIFLTAVSFGTFSLGVAFGWSGKVVAWVVELSLIAYILGLVVLLATQRGLSRAAARNRAPKVRRPPG